MSAKLYYVYDPMCSWCWGYAPTWQKLQQKLAPFIDIQFCVGGLAEDSNNVMSGEMQTFLKQTWSKISQQLGTQFNFDFWQNCQPRRSTFPACRAVLIARQYGKENEMLTAIQHAYYLQAKNPSNLDVLTQLAVNIGLNSADFVSQFQSDKLQEQLLKEITFSRNLPINGFPSLVLANNAQATVIPIDYQNWQISFDAIKSKL